jgi:hypothetical protein
MAGTITVSTLNDDTGVLATQNGMTGICKAWVNYNGAAQTVRGSFNVSSVTYNGVADYTVNFTTNMPNTNYAVVGSSRIDSSYQSILSPTTYNVASIRVKTSAIVQSSSFYYPDISNNLNNSQSEFVNVAILSS